MRGLVQQFGWRWASVEQSGEVCLLSAVLVVVGLAVLLAVLEQTQMLIAVVAVDAARVTHRHKSWR